MTLIGRPGRTARMPRSIASRVRSPSSRTSGRGSPAKNVAQVSPCTPSDEGGDVDLDESPSASGRESGMPWQITSLTDVHSDFGITLVAERGRVRAVRDQELVADPVELVGGDAGGDVPADLDQGVSRDASGDPHAGDRVGVLHHRVVVVGLRPRPRVDVVRPGDLGRHRAAGGQTPGLQRGGDGHRPILPACLPAATPTFDLTGPAPAVTLWPVSRDGE